MAISLFLHWVDNGFGSRDDIAICKGDVIIAVFTTNVEDGNTPGLSNRPFVKGETIQKAISRMEEYNTYPEDSVCLCGAYEIDHTTSAACSSASHIEHISLESALKQALNAKRIGVGRALFNKLQYLNKHDYFTTDW